MVKESKISFTGFIFKWRFVIALAIAAFILLMEGCGKGSQAPSQQLFEKYFEENVLNRNFTVSLAQDNGTDLTAQYAGWIFVLQKSTYYDGPMKATKNGTTYTGTWSSNDDYGKLVISITQPTVPAEFVFLNRQWRFTKKDLPTMELAPWGSSAPVVLHMYRQ